MADLETRMTAAEENIQGRYVSPYLNFPSQEPKFIQTILMNQPYDTIFGFYVGLQMTDVELDTRISILEENVGGVGANGREFLTDLLLECLATLAYELFKYDSILNFRHHRLPHYFSRLQHYPYWISCFV